MRTPAPIDTPAEIGHSPPMAPPPPDTPQADITQASVSRPRFRLGIDGTINITWLIAGIFGLAVAGFANVWNVSAEATSIKGSLAAVLAGNAKMEAEMGRRALWMEKKDLEDFELERQTTANREKITRLADGLATMATGNDVALIRKDLASMAKDLDGIAARISKLETR